MSEKRIWVCDGCDKEKDVSNGIGDWLSFLVSASGFRGYPTNAPDDPTEITGHLCPSCSKRYYDGLYPRRWPRETQTKSTA